MSAAKNSVVQQIEDLEDERDDFAAMLARIECANQESIPLGVVKRLSNCEPPVKVWREHRGLTIEEMADTAGVGVLTVRLMDMGEARGALLSDFAAIARVLKVELDLLVPWTNGGDGDP